MQHLNKTYPFITALFLMMFTFSFAQDEYIVNHSKFMQKTNPSYFGLNSLNKTGVLYNQMKLNEFDKMDNIFLAGGNLRIWKSISQSRESYIRRSIKHRHWFYQYRID